MKKIFVLCLAVLMLLSVGSCAKKEQTLYDVLSEAQNNVKALDEVDMDIVMDMSIDVMGMTMAMPVKMSMQAKGLTSGNPVSYIDMTMSMMGMDINMETYTEGEYVYIKTMGQGIKQKIEEADTGYANAELYEGLLQEIPQEVLETSAVVTENKDGSKKIDVEFTPETFAEVYESLVKEMSESTAEGSVIKSCDISDCKASVTISTEGYLVAYDLSFTMAMVVEAEGQEIAMEMTADMKCEINDPGKAVTVKTIEGYKDFPEATE